MYGKAINNALHLRYTTQQTLIWGQTQSMMPGRVCPTPLLTSSGNNGTNGIITLL